MKMLNAARLLSEKCRIKPRGKAITDPADLRSFGSFAAGFRLGTKVESIDKSEARSRVKRHAAGPKSANSGLGSQWVDDVRSL